MRVVGYSLVFCLVGIFACEQVEELTQREYPFVESIGITDLDESGATVNFEIKKTGTAQIDSFGIEFWKFTFVGDQSNTIQRIVKSGAPESLFQELRIEYDLLIGEYVVRPFVSSAGTVAYGENLVLNSQGVSAPLISSVTPRDINFIDQIHIQGDFFNSVLENNEVKLLGLEEKFNLQIDSVDNQNIWMKVNLKDISFFPTGERYDIQVRSGDKFTVSQDAIGVVPPQILSVEPSDLFVGDSLDVELNFFFNGSDFYFALGEGSGNEIPLFGYRQLEAGKYRVSVDRVNSGSFNFVVKTESWQIVFPEKVEILPSWSLFQSGIQAPEATEYGVVTSSERLIWVGSTPATAGRIFSLSLGSSVIQELPALPGFRGLRSRSASIAAQDRYLYFGLGVNSGGGSAENLKDFYRFDFQTGQWERLSDFPFDFTSVNKSVEINGKIYLVMDGYRNFREYDPLTNSWTLTPIEVPSSFRNTSHFVQVGSEIYSFVSNYPLRIAAFQYGQGERYLNEIYKAELQSINGMSYWDGNFIFTSNGAPSFRMDLQSSTIRPLQGLGLDLSGEFPIWPSRDGLLVPFPKNTQTGIQQNLIYRLIQDFN